MSLRIAMWSGPRNISTAMMRSFGARPDSAVIDEPFYAAYLAATGLDHPMRAEVLRAQSRDWRDVARALLGPVPGGRAVFYQKHMTQHMLSEIGTEWMMGCTSAFLIRRPAEVIASFREKRGAASLAEIGVVRQAELFALVADRLGTAPPVVDCADVAADPPGVLAALCKALGLEFLPQMLHWPAGRRDSDGVWAPAWYDQVERSTGFTPAEQRAPPVLDAAERRIAEQAEPLYRTLWTHRLVARH